MQTEIEPARLRAMVTDLLEQGALFAETGLPEVATALHEQAWALALLNHSDLADAAAWEVGWLALAAQAYSEAARWFERVTTLPESAAAVRQRSWPRARIALLQLCSRLVAESEKSARADSTPQFLSSSPTQPLSQNLQVRAHTAAGLPPLAVTTLGAFRLARGGSELSPGTGRKALTILRYLLTCERRTAEKEELMELLWPEHTPARASHSLHVAVSTLRRTIDPEHRAPASTPEFTGSYICYSPDHYRINADADVQDDASHFVELCRRADRLFHAGEHARARSSYESALELYTGDYTVESSDLLWATAQRERLLIHFLDALDHLGQICIAQQEWVMAASCYRRLVERDSFREDGHRALMLCAWKQGRRAEALRQYDLCAEILDRELGLEPMDETRALRMRLLDGLEG